MSLAALMRQNEDAVICDLAETYGIYDYRQHSPIFIATLVAGLDQDSRIARAQLGIPVKLSLLMSASIADRLALLLWAQTEDAQKGRNRPESLVESLLDKPEEKIMGFDSGEAFERARRAILELEGIYGN